MSLRRKVEVSFRMVRLSEAATVATGDTRVAAPVFWKVRVISAVSLAERGLLMGERVTSTTSWGTLSRGCTGMDTRSETVPSVRATLLK